SELASVIWGARLGPVPASEVVSSPSPAFAVSSVSDGRVRHRLQQPSGAFGGCTTPQLGQIFETAAIEGLRGARRSPTSISRTGESRAGTRVISFVLLHEPPCRGIVPVAQA